MATREVHHILPADICILILDYAASTCEGMPRAQGLANLLVSPSTMAQQLAPLCRVLLARAAADVEEKALRPMLGVAARDALAQAGAMVFGSRTPHAAAQLKIPVSADIDIIVAITPSEWRLHEAALQLCRLPPHHSLCEGKYSSDLRTWLLMRHGAATTTKWVRRGRYRDLVAVTEVRRAPFPPKGLAAATRSDKQNRHHHHQRHAKTPPGMTLASIDLFGPVPTPAPHYTSFSRIALLWMSLWLKELRRGGDTMLARLDTDDALWCVQVDLVTEALYDNLVPASPSVANRGGAAAAADSVRTRPPRAQALLAEHSGQRAETICSVWDSCSQALGHDFLMEDEKGDKDRVEKAPVRKDTRTDEGVVVTSPSIQLVQILVPEGDMESRRHSLLQWIAQTCDFDVCQWVYAPRSSSSGVPGQEVHFAAHALERTATPWDRIKIAVDRLTLRRMRFCVTRNLLSSYERCKKYEARGWHVERPPRALTLAAIGRAAARRVSWAGMTFARRKITASHDDDGRCTDTDGDTCWLRYLLGEKASKHDEEVPLHAHGGSTSRMWASPRSTLTLLFPKERVVRRKEVSWSQYVHAQRTLKLLLVPTNVSA